MRYTEKIHEARIYFDGRLILSVRAYHTETPRELRARILEKLSIVVPALDSDVMWEDSQPTGVDTREEKRGER